MSLSVRRTTAWSHVKYKAHGFLSQKSSGDRIILALALIPKCAKHRLHPYYQRLKTTEMFVSFLLLFLLPAFSAASPISPSLAVTHQPSSLLSRSLADYFHLAVRSVPTNLRVVYKRQDDPDTAEDDPDCDYCASTEPPGLNLPTPHPTGSSEELHGYDPLLLLFVAYGQRKSDN
jgi:hypothetical protein